MTETSRKALMASGAFGVVGVAADGPAGLGFLTVGLYVPLWFLLMSLMLPTGELLETLRHYTKMPKKEELNKK